MPIAIALAIGGCRLPPTQSSQPHAALASLWRQYQELPLRRALALSGDPDRAWVAAMAGGAERQEDAIDAALEGCRQKRKDRRLRTPCLLYAVDDEIVWTLR